MTTFHAKLGSISSGTMRSEDLIPAFIDALDDIREAIAIGSAGRHPGMTDQERVDTVSRLDDILGQIEQRMNAVGYWDSPVQISEDLEDLFNALDQFAPPYCYFGASEGDGSDYGFWLSLDCLEEDCETGEVCKVEAGTDWCHWPFLMAEYGLAADTPLGILADRLEDMDRTEDADLVRRLIDAKYILEVTDHGNATLYALDGSEVWSCV